MNYNPVLARWKFEETTTEKDKQNFRKYETFQVETTLRERNHTAKSAVRYLTGEDGLVYNELFSDEPFEVVLERGIAYRKEHGSKEIVREEAELEGWKKIIGLLSDTQTKAGTKAVVVSAPGLIEDTNYHDNFVDIYEATDSPHGERVINMTRYSSSLDYEQYWNKLQIQDRNYFQETNKPIDAWLLAHPLFIGAEDRRTADQIFDQTFERRKDAMAEADFQRLLVMCMPVINYYINVLTAGDFDPQKIALSWNAVLQKNDIVKKMINDGRELPLDQPLFNGNVGFEVNWLGRQVIETVAAGCGASEGFDVSKMGVVDQIAKIQLSNSVAKFGYDLKKNKDKNKSGSDFDEFGPLKFKCPKINDKTNPCTPGIIERPPHTLIPNCPHCGANIKC